jgi:uncharacterized protein YkwD
MRCALVIAIAAGCSGGAPRPRPAAPESVKATTAAPAAELDYDALARDVLAEINRVREDPRAYAEHLVALRAYYDGKLWRLPDRDPVRTKEGVDALDDAVRTLKRSKQAKPLAFDAAMSRAAADHAADIGPRGSIAHDGSNGSQPFTRLARYGIVIGSGAENIGVAFTDPRLFVIHQLIDDGVPDRGHRDNILARPFGRLGIACGPHQRYRLVCVMDFAEAFEAAASSK